MSGNENPLLVLEGLSKDFGKISALKGINVILDKPGVYGFLGPNGAGKTTAFKLISGLLRPTKGRVLIGGVDVQDDPRSAVERLGVLFDTPGFYPYMTGRENLLVIERWLGEERIGRIDELLLLVGLDGAQHQRVAGYSWGMKQRLGLAAALLPDPALVLLDEPTNGLDPGGIADIRRMLPKMAREQGRTVFLSSHRMEEVEQTCDHVTIIHKGDIVASGTLDELSTGDNRIEIRCSGIDAAIEILKGLKGVKEIEKTGIDRLRVFAPSLASSRINQLLVSKGVAVEHVLERRESLEEMFFRLTGMRKDEQ